APGDDHVLLPVADREIAVAVDRPAVTGVEPAVDDRLRGRLGLFPVPVEHDVGAGEHLAFVVDADGHAERGYTGAAELRGPFARGEIVPFGAPAVDREQRRRLGEPVDLDELPTELGLDPLDRARWRRRARHDDAGAAAPRHRPVPP